MKRTIYFSALTLVLCLLWATSGFAMAVDPWASYDDATHKTTKWQELSTNTASPTTSQYGVWWNVGGTGWTQDANVALRGGDKIQFKINMHKQNVGTHYADFVKLWVDFGQDGKFDEGNYKNGGDVVLFDFEKLADNETYTDYWGRFYDNRGTNNTPWTSDFEFVSDVITLSDSFYGDLFLRARTTCSESLGSPNPGDPGYDYYSAFLASGYLRQGESEDWKLTATPVPPSVLLFGTGLLGVMVATRRRYLP